MSVVNFPPEETKGGFALFALGFRPFFLASAIAATVLMVFWVAFLASGALPINYYPNNAWHGHEMLLGFALAVVVGFLLTAARNWTQVETITGKPLAIITLVWLAGRIAPFLPLPDLAIALIDLAFLPLATIFVLQPIVKAKQYSNLVFLPIMLAMIIGNLIFHLSLLEAISWPYIAGLDIIRWILVVLLVLMGGRVIPFFIERGYPGGKPTRSFAWVEKALVPTIVVAAISTYLPLPSFIVALLFMAAAIVHWARLAGWYQHGVWQVPILWILVIGYAWLPIGLSLMAFSQWGLILESTALHALMAGAVGTLTVGMMARVTRGHTGRDIQANRITVITFVLVVAAGLIRVFGSAFPLESWIISGSLWVVGFGIFTVSHFNYWLRPRVDGRPG